MRIAITGGIGSGKSEVLKLLENSGANVVSCDSVNASLLCDAVYINKIARVFPSAVINNKIDKVKLSSIVFNDKEKLEKLNSIAHPIIRKIILEKSSGDGINFVEVPLLFESNMQNDFDKVLLVTASKDIRLQRAVKRDNKSPEEIEKIISNQIQSYENKNIDYIIDNSKTFDDLRIEVNKFLHYLSK